MLRLVADMAAVAQGATVLRVSGQVDKSVLLQALAEACAFPAYFGHNWDAAWDCLGDCAVDDVALDLRAAESVVVADVRALVGLFADAEALYGRPRLWCVGADSELQAALTG